MEVRSVNGADGIARTFYSLLGVSPTIVIEPGIYRIRFVLSTPFWEFRPVATIIMRRKQYHVYTFYSLLGVS